MSHWFKKKTKKSNDVSTVLPYTIRQAKADSIFNQSYIRSFSYSSSFSILTGEINVKAESPMFDQLTVYKNPDDPARRNRGAEDNYVLLVTVKAYDSGE